MQFYLIFREKDMDFKEAFAKIYLVAALSLAGYALVTTWLI